MSLLLHCLLWLPLAGSLDSESQGEPAAEGIDPAAQAEYYRLHDEVRKLAKRQVWEGVGRLYLEMEATGAQLTYDDFLAGAMAARHAGDVLLTYERLTQAAKLDGTREVIEWLWSIDTSYGRVSLVTEPMHPSDLAVGRMPMLPDQRAAVEAAQRQVADTGGYTGMLPQGSYVFAGQEFMVTPGPKDVLIVVRAVEQEEGLSERRRKRD